MNGCVIPRTPIAVDYWKLQGARQRIHFLSHVHADHTVGLSSSWKFPIFTSMISAKLIHQKFNIDETLLKVIEIGNTILVPLDDTGKETMTVTVIDANHIAGAVMFLFEGYFGKILYTGDFRYHEAMFQDPPLYYGKSIDVLYLDNSYCNSAYEFPRRREVTEQIVKIISANNDKTIKIGLNKIGKEQLLIDIALKFKKRVCVSEERMATLRLLDVNDVFTTTRSSTNIHVVLQPQVTPSNLAHWNHDWPTIAIVPSALYLYKPVARIPGVYCLPYSDHSSFLELREFVGSLSAKVIKPTVVPTGRSSSAPCITDMSVFEDLLGSSPVTAFTVPESVSQYMATNYLNPSNTCRYRARGKRSKHNARKCTRQSKGISFCTPEKSSSLRSTVHESRAQTSNNDKCKEQASISDDLGYISDRASPRHHVNKSRDRAYYSDSDVPSNNKTRKRKLPSTLQTDAKWQWKRLTTNPADKASISTVAKQVTNQMDANFNDYYKKIENHASNLQDGAEKMKKILDGVSITVAESGKQQDTHKCEKHTQTSERTTADDTVTTVLEQNAAQSSSNVMSRDPCIDSISRSISASPVIQYQLPVESMYLPNYIRRPKRTPAERLRSLMAAFKYFYSTYDDGSS